MVVDGSESDGQGGRRPRLVPQQASAADAAQQQQQQPFSQYYEVREGGRWGASGWACIARASRGTR